MHNITYSENMLLQPHQIQEIDTQKACEMTLTQTNPDAHPICKRRLYATSLLTFCRLFCSHCLCLPALLVFQQNSDLWGMHCQFPWRSRCRIEGERTSFTKTSESLWGNRRVEDIGFGEPKFSPVLFHMEDGS